MAFNWARVAWTISFAVLALMAIFIYTEYSNRFRDRFAHVKIEPGVTSGVKRVDKPAEKSKGPPTRLPRRSRRYRVRK
ncbi:MAG: hypothetical protein HXS50_01780 [Theionarchaea archaeon]|nr:hypothetical protein [Theionarchaea archaeon]